MKKKAIIFDMDGVIIDTETYYMQLMRKNFEELNIAYTEELIHSFVGSNDNVITQKLDELVQPQMSGTAFLERVNDSLELTKEVYMALKKAGLYETLTHFKSRGYKLGLASSSPKDLILKTLELLEVDMFFDEISSGEEYDESKPHPEIYIHTMEKLGVSKDECVVVEDSKFGIEAGKAAGIYVVAIRDVEFGINQEEADIIVDGLEDVIKVVDDLERK